MDLIKPNSKSIVEQAREAKVNQKVEEIIKKSKVIVDKLKEMVYDSDIEVGDFEALLKAINSSLSMWYNEEVNKKRFNDISKR